MGKDSENFDDLAMFSGDKGFYDINGDGHLDYLEAGMMMGDISDEVEEVEREGQRQSNGDWTPPPTQGEGCGGCLWKSIKEALVIYAIWWFIKTLFL